MTKMQCRIVNSQAPSREEFQSIKACLGLRTRKYSGVVFDSIKHEVQHNRPVVLSPCLTKPRGLGEPILGG